MPILNIINLNSGSKKINSFFQQQKTTIALGVMILFWTLFQGIISYVTPILIIERGYSNTQMGLLYSLSSVFAVGFDFILILLIKKPNFRRLIFISILIGCAYSYLLWTASSLLVFIAYMSIWGLYTDIFNFGLSDFSGKFNDYLQNTKSVSLQAVFQATGFMLAPIISGSLIEAKIPPQHYAIIFVVMSIISYKIFISIAKKDPQIHHDIEVPLKNDPENQEVLSDKSAATFKKLFPMLCLVFLLYLNDATIWTIGPLLSESFPDFPNFGALFLMLTMMPGLFMIFTVPFFVKRLGKKKTGFLSFLLSLALLIPIAYIKNPIVVLLFAFISSLIGYSAYTSTKSVFADYLEESKRNDNWIIGLKYIFVNLGYIVGPFLIGFLSDQFGNIQGISIVAFISIVFTGILFLSTPKTISFKKM